MSTLVLVVAFITTALVWNGIVLKVLWGWFVVPTFGLPSLSLAVAIGIGLVASFLTHQYIPTSDEDTLKQALDLYAYPLLALVIGWVLQLFV